MNIPFINFFLHFLLAFFSKYLVSAGNVSPSLDVDKPNVSIIISARNKAHTLPHFLTLLSNLDYSKKNIWIKIYTDHNEDDTIEILNKWVNARRFEYHDINLVVGANNSRYDDELDYTDWSQSRFNHIIDIKEREMSNAKVDWADYVWFLDCDVFLTNALTLSNLISHNETATAPMLKSVTEYSNFWSAMGDNFYYSRTDEYASIFYYEKVGCHVVPMIHSAVLINLHAAPRDLTFDSTKIKNYNGPRDDIIALAISANKSGTPLHICNDMFYGYIMVPLEEGSSLNDDKRQMTSLKVHIAMENPALAVDELLQKYDTKPEKSLLGFDGIHVINLKRRPNRRQRMIRCLDELGLNGTIVEAIDGEKLPDDFSQQLGISVMPNYLDPYHKRPMTKGEIGCFLSHYGIWKDMVANNMKEVLILEDDIRFEFYFMEKLRAMLAELRSANFDWDLAYLGRKRGTTSEQVVPLSKYFLYPEYSYWTLGYILNLKGAKKLLNAKPLDNLIPVDEFFPIMYDKHPRADWKSYFPNRTLLAVSSSPLLVYPMKYTNEEGYVSDTEDSPLIYPHPNNQHQELR